MLPNYLTLREQLNVAQIPQHQLTNILAVTSYEKMVLNTTNDTEELLNAYPHEEEKGIYTLAVNGSFCASNNKRAISAYMDRLENISNTNAFIHKLGAKIDFNLVEKLKFAAIA